MEYGTCLTNILELASSTLENGCDVTSRESTGVSPQQGMIKTNKKKNTPVL